MTSWTMLASTGAMLLISCKPNLIDDEWYITSARVLAVKSEPAEARPGTALTWSAMVANPLSQDISADISWRFCTAPKPPTESNVVSTACLEAASLVEVGTGQTIVASTAPNACALFGPNTPPGGFRPRDPDATGGYYQPLRVDLPDAEPLFHLQRITCNLADASADIAAQFGKDYLANSNPHLIPISFSVGGKAISIDNVRAGTRIELKAAWSAQDAEHYAYFERDTQSVSIRRESMRVSWYVDAGILDIATNGRGEDDPLLTANNIWTAPAKGGLTHLWVVLRDSRGGVDFAEYKSTILP